MALWNCPSCERHIRPQSTSCPFCGTTLGTVEASPQRTTLVVALGLALWGCGDKDDEQTTAATMSASATGESDTDASTGVDTGSSTTHVDPDSGAQDYAGPGTTTLDFTTGSTGGETETETDTGSTTSGSPGTDSGGQDYAGTGVVEPEEG